ncbi:MULTISPECIES: HAMP domain-containing sensor histidine kinase [Leuconostoc]|uniref:histidine kinase n=2 Tax=Leuconostoc kimchii TaxID=136609 RepID=D5T205_LEUKI|nr:MULTISPECIES: sensor histidine kinase [Leuconostoc]ADG40304.1 sensor protein kinase [Leuconostoc kimchii IMSNU 11154]AEJ31751.1 sensor protein kinase [Leuconostoc sp. C2]QBR46818.1 HAMP domain-containing histidine kinase [Leuconostoc kimchii]
MYWGNYLKRQLGLWLTVIVGMSLFLCTFFLWQLPMISLLNASLLFLLMLLVYATIDYQKFRHEQRYIADLEIENEQTRTKLAKQMQRDQAFMDMMRVWTHQMKVPLASLDLIAQTRLPELQKQTFELENYLTILLEYLRVQNIATDFRFEVVNIRELVNQVVKKYARQFIHKNLNVTIVGNAMIKTDAKWLTVAVEQIINNAVKYTESGGLRIDITDQQLRMTDSGIGILASDLPRLFSHGFTGYNGRLDKKSSGLGLYLSKLVLDKLSCDITVTSKIDVGTTVTISFLTQR